MALYTLSRAAGEPWIADGCLKMRGRSHLVPGSDEGTVGACGMAGIQGITVLYNTGSGGDGLPVKQRTGQDMNWRL